VALLAVEQVTRRFGGVVAVDDVTLDVGEGEIVGLIGPNGAGKTTLFNLITRLYKPDAGEIAFDGESLLHTPAYRVVRRGIARTFQNVELFESMTVLEHVLVGRHARRGRSARELLAYAGLSPLAHRPAAQLSYGTRKRVELARALAAGPRLLLLDEPSMGLAPIFVERIFDIIREINEQGTTILLVEQNALMALDAADRGYVLETGRIALADDAKSLRANEDVRKTYLGES
jgi:ABC-type branched-subunit amino acid transport system ATPase component